MTAPRPAALARALLAALARVAPLPEGGPLALARSTPLDFLADRASGADGFRAEFTLPPTGGDRGRNLGSILVEFGARFGGPRALRVEVGTWSGDATGAEERRARAEALADLFRRADEAEEAARSVLAEAERAAADIRAAIVLALADSALDAAEAGEPYPGRTAADLAEFFDGSGEPTSVEEVEEEIRGLLATGAIVRAPDPVDGSPAYLPGPKPSEGEQPGPTAAPEPDPSPAPGLLARKPSGLALLDARGPKRKPSTKPRARR